MENPIYCKWFPIMIVVMCGAVTSAERLDPSSIFLSSVSPGQWDVLEDKLNKVDNEVHLEEIKHKKVTKIHKQIEKEHPETNSKQIQLPTEERIVLRNDGPIKFNVLGSTAICETGSWGARVKLSGVESGMVTFQSLEDDESIQSIVGIHMPPKALNPFKWGVTIPDESEVGKLEGLLFCVKPGDSVQFIDPGPVMIPEPASGNWARRGIVETLMVTKGPDPGSVLVHCKIRVTLRPDLPPITVPPMEVIPFTAILRDLNRRQVAKLQRNVKGTEVVLKALPADKGKTPRMRLELPDIDLAAAELAEVTDAISRLNRKFIKGSTLVTTIGIGLPIAAIALGGFLEKIIKPFQRGTRWGLAPTLRFEHLRIFRLMQGVGFVGLAVGFIAVTAYFLSDGTSYARNISRLKKKRKTAASNYAARLKANFVHAGPAKPVRMMIVVRRPSTYDAEVSAADWDGKLVNPDVLKDAESSLDLTLPEDIGDLGDLSDEAGAAAAESAGGHASGDDVSESTSEFGSAPEITDDISESTGAPEGAEGGAESPEQYDIAEEDGEGETEIALGGQTAPASASGAEGDLVGEDAFGEDDSFGGDPSGGDSVGAAQSAVAPTLSTQDPSLVPWGPLKKNPITVSPTAEDVMYDAEGVDDWTLADVAAGTGAASEGPAAAIEADPSQYGTTSTAEQTMYDAEGADDWLSADGEADADSGAALGADQSPDGEAATRAELGAADRPI